MIDILLLLIVGLVTWCVAGEGAWGAAFTCISVLFAGLLAMNFFEPLAIFLQNNFASTGSWPFYWDCIALVGLFTLLVFLLRSATEYLSPSYIHVNLLAHELIRWPCAFLTGYITMAFLLTALHTAPLPREFLGFTPERRNFLGITAPDRQWLGFTQYVSEHSLRKGGGHLFDGPQFELGPQNDRYPNNVWPSFPLRYATRRETYADIGASTSSSGESGTTNQLKRRTGSSNDGSNGNAMRRTPSNAKRRPSNPQAPSF